MNTIIELIKLDLGISHNKRDGYFAALVSGAVRELSAMGIHIDTENCEQDDIMLVVDFSLWRYRKRTDDVPLAENIRRRIRDRKIRGRVESERENI